jgi:hypothetical protein
MKQNMVGLEAEFLVRKNGNIVLPADYYFSTDDYCVLGEFRAEPGSNRYETMANFMKEYYKLLYNAKTRNVEIDMTGYAEITPEFQAKIMRQMGSKEINQCQNLYGIDILKLSDAVIEDGVIIKHMLSTGLHVHFSSKDIVKYTIPTYKTIHLPKSMFTKDIQLYTDSAYDPKEFVLEASLITMPVLNMIVKSMDSKILPQFKLPVKLKFRNKGFYEIKDWGFEYRSLPFNWDVFHELFNIVDHAFTLLESLDLK